MDDIEEIERAIHEQHAKLEELQFQRSKAKEIASLIQRLETESPESAALVQELIERAESAERDSQALEDVALRAIRRAGLAESGEKLLREELEEERKTRGEERQKDLNDASEVIESVRRELSEELGRRIKLEIRLEALAEIEREAAEMRCALAEMEGKPFDPRERATFERLLYVLAREAGYKLEKPHSDEVLIREYAARIGATAPTGKGSIARKLEAAIERYKRDCEN